MNKFKIINKLLQLSIGVMLITEVQKVNAVQVTLDDISPTADSGTIFNSGSPSLTTAREATAWIQAEDFVLNQNSTLKNIKFWTLEPDDAVWDGTIEYSIFNDIDDTPDTVPFAAGTGVEIKKEATGRTLYDIYKEFAYSFDLDNHVSLSANRKYWLGLHLSSNFDLDQIYWQATDTGYGIKGKSAYLGNLDDWSRSSEGVERAFELSSISSSDSQPVPEPSTMLGSCIALSIGISLRRKFASVRVFKKYPKNS
jgi:hypothetical protein